MEAKELALMAMLLNCAATGWQLDSTNARYRGVPWNFVNLPSACCSPRRWRRNSSARAIIDEHPGPALARPAAPGRPAELRFKPQGSGKRNFPACIDSNEERERGRLLHFFANHELLATELMALVLLRFPEAPGCLSPRRVADAQGRAGSHPPLP